jgi:hypothetical protein
MAWLPLAPKERKLERMRMGMDDGTASKAELYALGQVVAAT